MSTPPSPANLPVLSDANSASALPVQSSVSIQLDQGSLAAIATAHAEAAIRTKISELRARRAELVKTYDSLQKALATYLEAWTEARLAEDAPLKDLLAAASKIFPTSALTILQPPGQDDPKRKVIETTITVGDRNGDFYLSRDYTTALPSEVPQFRADIESAAKAIQTLDVELLQARQALTNLDSVERRARAAIGEQMALRSGEAGRALVDGIKATVNPDGLINSLTA
jgi:hypothetical protein